MITINPPSYRSQVATFASAFLIFALTSLFGQVTLNPPFVTQNDTVEVIFDASQGNAALVGISPVYAHTGVITNLSTTPTTWRHVQGNWGTADSKMLMTPLGNNLHSLKFHINSFYNVPSGETVEQLAFVFRNADGSVVGRASGGGDIFVPLAQSGFQLGFANPSSEFGIYNVNDTIEVQAQTSDTADLQLFLNGNLLTQQQDTTAINYSLPLINYGSGLYQLELMAVDQGSVYRDTVEFLARSGSNIAVDTGQYEEGITILNDSAIALKLRAPYKDFVYVVGDFNDWQPHPDYEMYKDPSQPFFWIVIDSLDPQKEYAFQYHIDQEALRVADPYSEKVLDGWNDFYIPSSVYPNLKSYPDGKTNFPVSVVRTGRPEYQWAVQNFEKPDSDDLVIYELLIRDFDQRHSYLSVIDRLSYLDSLGINAIQLMPVMEFEGNESWGYNPMFFMAPDKYYGTADHLKMLIDSCHARGIAVILDIAMNHAFGQHPFVRMYFDAAAGQYGQPTAQNPWFNQVPKHDFNVGYDFDHSSDATEYYTKRVFQHWVEEYRVDGYRVDLSKGFTQRNTLGNVAAWGQYDQNRINILTRIKNEVHEIDSNAYMILEHFADNSEEQELASRGFMLWGHMNHQYNEATMGYPSDLSNVYHGNRNWSAPGLVSYMESHDEERLMYKNILYGNSSGNYSTKDTATALDRMELAAAFFFMVPGPKMLWQFGELGYDYPINYCPDGTVDPGCRLANKPIRWDYLEDPDRLDLFMHYSNFINFKTDHPRLFEGNFSSALSGNQKSIILEAGDSSMVAIGNFAVTDQNVNITFPSSGKWYDFNTGDSIMLSGNYDTTYAPGEYHIYTNFPAAKTFAVSSQEVILQKDGVRMSLFPNPSPSPHLLVQGIDSESAVLRMYDLLGNLIHESELRQGDMQEQPISIGEIGPRGILSGIYVISLETDKGNFNLKWHKP